VAFGAKLVPIRVLGRCGARVSDIAEAMIWAAGGSISGVPANPYPAKVLSLSLGAPGVCDATSQNIVNIAAGNENGDAANFLPANCEGVIAVAATTRQGGKAAYSNFGEVVDIAAPGGDIRTVKTNGVLSTLNGGTTTPGSDLYDYDQGTSMATPHVAGVAALMLSRANLLPDQVESIIKGTARAFPATCNQCGEGLLDAYQALNTTMNLPAPVAFLRGGSYEPKFAGISPTFTAEQLGFIVEYKLTRRNSSGVVAQEFKQTTPVFNNLPAVGCIGESHYWTLTVTDALGRTDTWTQRSSYFYHPSGVSIPCGR
jgi:subtilisin family serine protease